MPVSLIALDVDGVLLDFHAGYARAWERAFGLRPVERDPLAYWPIDRWQVERLEGEPLSHFARHFDEEFWGHLPALPGAVEACRRLVAAGHELVCVSALDGRFEALRLRNLQALGFPVDTVVATGHAAGARSPKADALARLQPAAFVDDYLPYLRGVPDAVHRALVLRGPNGSPNAGPELALAHSTHDDLGDFVDHWLNRAV